VVVLKLRMTLLLYTGILLHRYTCREGSMPVSVSRLYDG
jgi:hypothetical protein